MEPKLEHKLTKSVTFNEIEHAELLTWLRESGKFERNIWSPFVRHCLEKCMREERSGEFHLANGNAHNGKGNSTGHDATRQVIAQALDERQLSLSEIRRTIESVLQSLPLVTSEGEAGNANDAAPDDQDWFNQLDDSLVVTD